METERNDVRGAREALEQAAAGERAVRAVPVRAGYFPTLAALMAAVFLAQLLPTAATIVVTLVLAAGCGVLAGLEMRRVGVVTSARRSPTRKLGWIAGAGLAALVALCAVLDAAAGLSAVWVVGAVVAALAVLAIGRRVPTAA